MDWSVIAGILVVALALLYTFRARRRAGVDVDYTRLRLCRARLVPGIAGLCVLGQQLRLLCKMVPGVLKELTVFAIVYNLVRMVMRQSATLQHTAVERISCLDALRWLSAPQTGMPLVALIMNPARPHRLEPRVKKRRPKSFPLMIKPRQALRQQLMQYGLRG